MFPSEILPQISCHACILSGPQQHCASCFAQPININKSIDEFFLKDRNNKINIGKFFMVFTWLVTSKLCFIPRTPSPQLKNSPQNAFYGTPPFWKYQHIQWKHKYLEKNNSAYNLILHNIPLPYPPQWKKYTSLLYHDFRKSPTTYFDQQDVSRPDTKWALANAWESGFTLGLWYHYTKSFPRLAAAPSAWAQNKHR